MITDASKHPSIQAAIDAADEFVYIPPGTWTESLVCRQEVNIRLARSAILNGNVQLNRFMTFSGGLVYGNLTFVSPCALTAVRDVRLFGSLILEVNGTYINNNVFSNIWINSGGIVINAHGSTGPGTGEISGNVFQIFHQPDEKSIHVFEMYGFAEYNDLNICSLDWGNDPKRGAALVMDEQTFYNRIYLSGNIEAKHVDHRGALNAVTVARPQ